MPLPAIAALEAALRTRKLDRTLTSALPSLERTGASAVVPTGLGALDACLRGGLPRGQLSEIAGPPSSGRTTLLLHLIASAAERGEIAALVDTLDRFDLISACAAGVDLDRLLWVRGHAITASGDSGLSPQALLDRTVDRTLKALNLVLQAGGFGVVALDLADVPLLALKRIPFTTWLRVQRAIEGSDTACVLVTPGPLARSAGGITVSLDAVAQWTGHSDRSRRLAGLEITTRVMSPRQRVQGEARLVARASDSR
jgi:recombination protein RecA